ncbi:YDG domain-containing protein [Duganella qianjiadongensis]|uniref:Filamentous hemagglutinin N-terminal domain-containing protein n=1 Tax=Duganella qianjiadongensis TaxID=2692176 RepID=A0ABW9VS62_9BURK|nr:YDG domain-containing protein [Duganella qianjiadongensis]MYM41770.1 filamentous hemagglutinin N-terminal domain-containing protein [Duganella qianjiadongensis]
MKSTHRRPSAGRAPAPLRRKVLAVLVAACYSTAQAGPLAPNVVAGQASFSQQGKTYTITNLPNTIINWQGFSLATDEIAKFVQQSADSRVLNRITGQDPSVILGAIQSNGKVFLINPNGVLFGAGAQVDVNGLVASSLALSNSDFLAGKNNFSGSPDAGKVSNAGTIRTPAGGQVFLIAPSVENRGIISTENGEVVLAAGHSVQLFEAADPNLQVVVSAASDQALNLGQIVAQGGRIGVYGALVNQRGRISADSAVRGANGKIMLKSSGTTLLEAGSSTSATGSNLNIGGDIMLLGPQVGLTGDAVVDASGAAGGGTVLLGGDYQGRNPAIANAKQSYVGKDSVIRADAISAGDGGKVIVWGDDATRMYGSISARGGARSGNGGLIETSGHVLDMRGQADTRAAQGKTGTLLLDPANIYIADELATAINLGGMSEDPANYSILSGDTPFSATGPKGASLLTTGTLAAALQGSNVSIVSVASNDTMAPGAGNIKLLSSLSWDSNKTLRLDATGNIELRAAVSASQGGLDLHAGGAISQSTSPIDALQLKNLSAIAADSLNLINEYNQVTNAVSLQSTSSAVSLSGHNLLLGTVSAQDTLTVAGSGTLTVNNGATLTSGASMTLSSLASDGNLVIGSSSHLNAGSAITLSVPDTGNHRITNNGSVHASGSLLVSAGKMTLASGSLYGSGGTTLSTGNPINLGVSGNAADTLELVDNDFYGVSNTRVYLTSTQAAAADSILVSGALSLGRSVTMTTNGSIRFAAPVQLGDYSGLTLYAGDGQTVTASSALDISGTFSLQRGNWNQVSATLPAFSAGNFVIGANSTFLRAKGGNGSSATPYLISDIYGLQGAAGLAMSNSYTLTNNIDAAGTEDWNSHAGFVPIGSEGNKYTGVFDGGGFAISDLTIHRPSQQNVGLFAYLGNGTVRNLTLASGEVSGAGVVGALAAATDSSSQISNVSSAIDVAGDWDTGGLVGQNRGSISHAGFSGTVTAGDAGQQSNIGGLVGYNGGSISYSQSSGSVHSTSVTGNVGGLVGSNHGQGSTSAEISNSYATGEVYGAGQNVGGLVGDNLGGIIRTSYASGSVSGGRNIGALAGHMDADGSLYPLIENSYATGNLSSNDASAIEHENMGGAVGLMAAGTLQQVFYSGSLDGSAMQGNVHPLVGSAAGGSSAHLYYNSETVNASGGPGTGLTAAQMMHAENFSGFDFASTPVWRIYEGYTQPLIKSLLTPLTVTLSGGSNVSKTFDGQSSVLSGVTTSAIPNGVSGTLGWAGARNVGTYNVGGLYSTRYDISYAGSSPQLVITPRQITATATANKVYDGLATLSRAQYGFTIHGAISNYGDLEVEADATFANKNVGAGKALTISSATLSGSEAGNYTLVGSVTGTGTITARPIYLNNLSLQSTRPYNGSDIAQITGGTSIGSALNGDDVHLATVGTASAYFSNKNVGNNKPVTVILSGYQLGGNDAGNYMVSVANELTASITPAALTLSGVTALDRVYNRNLDPGNGYATGTLATLNTSQSVLTGIYGSDQVSLAGATASFSDRNVGTNKSVTVHGATLSGADSGNYMVSTLPTGLTASITPVSLNLTLASRQYNNSTLANLEGAALSGVLTWGEGGSDNVTLVPGSAVATYADKNVGVAKAVTISGGALTLGGSDGGNYVLNPAIVGTITARPASTWIGSGGGLWSSAANWQDGIAPDGSNVLAAVLGSGAGTVTYDASAGNTSVNTLSGGSGTSLTLTGGNLTLASGSSSLSGGALTLNGGNLAANGNLSVGVLNLSSGVLSGTNSGAVLTLGQINHTGGSINTSGMLTLEGSGNIAMGTVRAQHGIVLATSGGAVSQTGPWTSDSLTVSAHSGVVLSNPDNHVNAFSATSGSGDITLYNNVSSGALMLGTLSTEGNILIDNHGGIVLNGPVHALHAQASHGHVSITAHSPVTVNDVVEGTELAFSASTSINLGSAAALNAVNQIQLTAGTDIVLGGALSVTSGSITATATNGSISVGSATSISTNGGSLSLSAPQGSVSSSNITLGSNTVATIDSGSAAAAAAAAAQAAAAADAAAKAAADAAAKAAADAAAKAAADAAAKAAADAAAKAAADAAAQAAADAATKAAADAAAKAAADAAAKAAADAAAKAAADAAAKAAADAAAKAAADAAAQAAAAAAAKAAADAAAKAAADAAADAAAKAAANAAAGSGQPSEPITQIINTTVNLVNVAPLVQTDQYREPPHAVAPASVPAASGSGSGSGSGTGAGGSTAQASSGGPSSGSAPPDDKKTEEKTTDKAADVSKPATEKPLAKTYCN